MNPEEDKQYPWWRRSLDTLRYALRIPYTLNVEVIQPSRRSGRAYVFIHGIGNTLHSWDEVCRGMPDDARLIKVDLLGFGDSPKPRRAVYDARFQARCVLKTLLGLRFARRPVIVGHSLGALVAIEIARRYPVLFKKIILCSPPLYMPANDERLHRFSQDVLLRRLYSLVRRHPGQLEKILPIARRVGLANKSLSVKGEVVSAYIASLEASIINQSSLRDVERLRLPVHIIYGTLDPLVVGAHIQSLQATRSTITTQKIVAGHEVVGRFARTLVAALRAE